MNILTIDIVDIIGISSILILLSLVAAFYLKMQRLKELRLEIARLKKSLDEMDEQAKLIVRTDMELNKTQEALDKKVSGLYALQRLSRQITTTLEEKQIFNKIKAENLEDVGMEKALAFLWHDKEKRFSLYLNIGYTESELKGIQSFVDTNHYLYLNLIENAESLSSISMPKEPKIQENTCSIFKVKSFVISSILPKEGDKGFLFVGTENPDTFVTEGDEELINILTNQIGQTLENARLFEKTWRTQQNLEKKVEERTRELTLVLDELKTNSQRKTDFVSSVSHELRTPLTSIKGYASILLTGKLGELPKEAKERVDKINRHSDELVHLVNDLLDISRIESGRISMKQETENLKDIVTQVTDLLSVQIKDKQLELSINIPTDANKVLIDRSQIERVFINIIGNAIKFTPQKGKITINSHKINEGVQIDITDTGYGIPKEAQEAIFEEFYRVDNAINQQVKGTGLGLALVRRIIEAHKGKIWVKSKEDEGSTFSFTLLQQK